MEDRILEKINEWKAQRLPADLADDLMFAESSEEELSDRFYKDLEFGTAGLRGILGAGTNRMNIYTVGRTTAAFAKVLKRKNPDASIAIAYDSRINSDIFARITARIMAAHGVKVYIWPELSPTPTLSYAVRHFGCDGGVVITASHNPSKYNGYKVYDSTGCQLGSSAAAEVFEQMKLEPMFPEESGYSYEKGLTEGMIEPIPKSVRDAFIKDASAWSMGEGIDKSVKIAYTPLYGTGLRCVTEIYERNGFTNMVLVDEQAEPNGNFPTCPYPNPEFREAMEVGLRVAKEKDADILIATDPDADRVGIAVKDGDDYKLITGDQTGMLILDYLCRRRTELGVMPKDPVAVKSIVSTDMIYKIADDYGVEVRDVLTGFKNIAPVVNELVKAGEGERYIFGYEESYGYMLGTHVRDKDAISAALIIAEMFAYHKGHGKSLLDVLDDIYQKYGYYYNSSNSYYFEGASGFEKMEQIMDLFRNDPPKDFAGIRILEVQDYKNGFNGLGPSNVLKYVLEDHNMVVLRPSGTEPKLKLYIGVGASDMKAAEALNDRIVAQMDINSR